MQLLRKGGKTTGHKGKTGSTFGQGKQNSTFEGEQAQNRAQRREGRSTYCEKVSTSVKKNMSEHEHWGTEGEIPKEIPEL